MSESVYGVIVDADEVQEAALQTARLFVPDLLREAERQKGIPEGSLDVFKSHRPSNEDERWPEDQLPALIARCPGTTGSPQQAGDGTVVADYVVGMGLVVQGRDKEQTNKKAKIYTSVVRTALLQHGSLGGLAESTQFEAESFSGIPHSSTRTLASGQIIFTVSVRVSDARRGTVAPLGDPTVNPTWPTPEVTLELEEMSQNA